MKKENINILIVDTDAHYRSTLGFELKSHGFHVSMASSGIKAFELFPQMPFDVIIADLAMPAGNGLAILRTLKDKDLHIPVLITTTDRALDPEKVLKMGAAGVLHKPVVSRHIIEKIRKIGGLPEKFGYFLNIRHTLVVVSWIGDLRVKDKEALLKCSYEIEKAGAPYVVLNLPGFSGYDSELLGEISKFQERISKTSGELMICGPEQALRERIVADGLAIDSDILPSLKDALQKILETGND